MNSKSNTLCAIGMITGLTLLSWQAQAQDKWEPYIDLEGKIGNERDLGEIDFFMPLLQDDDTLFFSDIRIRKDNNSSSEGNFGVGMRRMLDNGWNVGAYGYFDRRKTSNDNYFNQVTLGAELLGEDWDARVNAYQPIGDKNKTVDALNSATLSGSSFTVTQGSEVAMKGFDAEVGYRLPVFDADSGTNLRAYAGGYHFSADTSGVEDVQGPRLRLDLTFDELPFAWEGSRFSIGAEWQNDDPRGSQGFVSARLRIPFSAFTGKSSASKTLNRQERRMMDPIVRDVDVVTQAGAYGRSETATETTDGQSLTVVSSDEIANTADLNTALANAGANTVIVADRFDVTTQVNVPAGQTLIGSGEVGLRTPSGMTATANVSGGTFAATNTGQAYLMLVGNNTHIKGMNLSNSDNGGTGMFVVRADNRTDVIIENNTLTAFGASGGGVGIDMRNSTNAIVRNNTITASSNTAGAVGALVTNASNATIANNSFSLSTSGPKTVLSGNGATSFNADSTGNTTNDGACNFAAPPTGSVGFSTINCP